MPEPIDLIKYHFETQPSQDYNSNSVFGNQDYGKSTKYDNNITSDQIPDIGEIRAKLQPNARAVTNGIVQGLFRATGDAIGGFGYLYELKDIFDTIQNTETEFGNALTRFGDSITEKGQNLFPVYASEQNAGGFRPFNGEWWGQNVPSIFSTLSLMFPGLLAVKGLSLASKLTSIGSKWGTGTKLATKGIAAAVTSRHIENMMEAKGSFETVYNELRNIINPETGLLFTDAEAKKSAGEAAAFSYNANWANLMTDIPQYMFMMGGMKFSSMFKGKQGLSDMLKTAAMEGGEESFQFVVGKEAEVHGIADAGIESNSNFVSRFGDYIKDPELYSSAFMGALGGGLFGGISIAANRASDKKINDQLQEIADNWDNMSPEQRSEELFKPLNEKNVNTITLGKVSQATDLYESQLALNDQELIEQHGETRVVQGKEMKIRDALTVQLEQVKSLAKKWDSLNNDAKTAKLSTDLKKELLTEFGIQNEAAGTLNNLKNTLATQETAVGTNHPNLSFEGQQRFKLQQKIKGLTEFAKDNKIKDYKPLTDAVTELNKLVEQQKELTEDVTVIEEEDKVIKTITDNTLSDLHKKSHKQQLVLNRSNEITSNILADVTKAENDLIEKTKKETAKKEKEATDLFKSSVSSAKTPLALANLAQSKSIPNAAQLVQEEYEKRLAAENATTTTYDNKKSLADNLITRYGKVTATGFTKSFLADKELGDLGFDVSNKQAVDNLFQQIETNKDVSNQIMSHIKTLQEAKDNSTLNDITDNPDGVLTDNSDYDNSNVNYTQSFTETPFDILTSQVEFDKNNNIIYDKTTGRPVESTKYDFDVDFTWLNNSDNLQPDTVLHYEVDNDYKSKELKDDGKPVFDNSKQSSNSKLIMVVHYINGKTEEKNPSNRKIVGVVKAHGKQLQDPNLKQLREDITKENPGTGTFTFSKTTTIIEKHKGRFWTIKGQRKPVHEAFAPNQPMVFGIVRYTADGMHRLEVPNIENYYQNEETGAVRNIYTDPQQLIPGTVHAIIESTNGDLVSYPLYTRKVKEVPVVQEKVKSIIQAIVDSKDKKELEANITLLQDYVYVPMNYENGVFNILEETNTGFKRRKKLSFTQEQFVERLDNYIVQIYAQGHSDYVNKRGYNEKISKEGRLFTDLNYEQHFHSTRVTVETYNPNASSGETIPLADQSISKTKSETSDVEAKKADIERRRQENDTLGKSILQKLGYKNENRLPNGNVKGGQSGWKIRFNIKNPKTGESYYDGKGTTTLLNDDYNKRAETLINFLLNYFGSNEKADSKNLQKHYVLEDKDGTRREPFKHLSGGEIGESDFTIYIGSADDVMKFISDIRTSNPEILKLLHTGNKSGDISIDDIFKGRIEGSEIGFSGYHTPTNLNKVTGSNDFTFNFNQNRVNINYNGNRLSDITIFVEGSNRGYKGVFDENLKNDFPELYKNIRNIVGFQLYGNYLQGSNNEFLKLTGTEEINAKYDAELDASEQSNNNQSDTNTEIEKLKQEWEKELNKIKERLEKHLKEAESEPDSAPKVKIKKADGTIDTNSIRQNAIAAANALYEYSINRINAEYTAKIAALEGTTSNIVSASFTGQGTTLEIEIKGEKKDFLLTWNRNNTNPTLWGNKKEDGSYTTTDAFPSKEDIQKLVDKYVPIKLLNLINEWVEASKLPSEQVLDTQSKIENKINAELKALEQTTPQSSPEELDSKVVNQSAVTEREIENIKDNKNFIILSEDGTHYLNTKTGKKLKRVTGFINEKEAVFPQKQSDESLTDYRKRLVELFKGEEKSEAIVAQGMVLASSQVIGTKVDVLVRDFFDGKLKPLSEYNVSDIKTVEAFVEQLKVLQAKLKKNNEIVVANDIVLYNDELGIAGSVDLLTYDNKGVVRIYDMKTMRGNKFEFNNYGENKYDNTSVFELTGELKVSGEPKYTVNKSEKQDSDRVKHQKQLSLYRILLYNTHGLKADKLTIIPIDVEYTMGDEATSHLDLLDTVTLVPLKEVNGAKLKKPVKTEKKVEPVVESTTEEEIGEIETKPKLTSPDKPKPIVEVVEPQVEVAVPITPVVETTETTTEEKPKVEGRQRRGLGKPSEKTTGLSGIIKLDNDGKPVYKRGTISKHTRLETEKEAEWFKKNFPQISRYVVDNLREVYKNSPTDGLAMFYKSAMYISKNVPEGTTFHEAFHIIFRLFLTPEQQIGIMEEAKSRYGIPSSFTIKDIIDEHSELHPEDKPLTAEQATSLYYEELIADEFSEYLQAQEKTAYTLPSKIKRFFQKLYQTIKSVVTSKVSINDIFMRGNTEYYKNKKVFDRNVSNFRTKYPAFKIAGFKDPKTAHRRLSYLRQLVKNELELYRTSTHKELAKYEDAELLREIQKTLPEGVSVINKIYIEIVNKINKEINDYENEGNYEMADKFGDLLEALVKEPNDVVNEDGTYGVKVWGDAYFASIKDLANMGLKFNAVNNSVNNSSENNTEDGLPIFEMNEDETFTEGWMIKLAQVSSKDSISQKLKKFLDSIPIFNTTDIYNTDGSLKLNNVKLGDLNEILYEDGSSIFNYLQRNLHDIYHPDTMVKKLEELSKYKPYAKYVLSKVNADPKLKADLFVYVASKSHVNFGFLKEVLGEFRLFSSNRTTITNMIIQDWYTTFKQSDIVDAEDVINVDIVKPIRDRLLRGIDQIEKGIVTDQTFHALEKISRELGFEISAKTFKSLYVEKGTGKFKTTAEQNLLLFLKGTTTSKYSFLTLVNLLADGTNVFKEGASESTLLKSLANVLKIFDESNHQSAFKGVDGQSNYSHISSNFMTKMMANLKSPSREVLNNYLRTKFYMSSPWLNELKYNTESRDEFELMLLDGLKPENAEDGKKYTELSPAELYSTLMNAYSNNNNSNYGYYGVPTLSDAPVEAFIKFKKYSLKKNANGSSEILDALYEAALQEYNRIELVKRELNSENLITKIKNKYTGDNPHGLDFQMFPFLNKYKLDMGNGEVGRKVVISVIEAWLNERYVEEIINLKELKLIKTNKGKVTFNKHIIDKRITDHNTFLREFIYNDILANTQLITIFSGDPASYKQGTLVEDFFKRNKQIWSPGLHMDMTVPGVKPTYKTIIANDSKIKNISKIYNNAIEKTLANLGYNNKVVQDILKAYDEVNETDAQGYVDIIRYKEIMLGFNRWTDKHEAALPNLIAGTATSDEIRLVLQPIKPFYFGHIILPNGEINAMQNKNSEYLLLPQLAKGNKKLEKLMNQFGYNFNGSQVSYLEENRKTDSIQFDSAVKVGLYGNVDLDNIDNAVVHTLNNSDYKLQVETPEHHIDADNLFGSQIRKLIMSDINVDGDYELPTLPDSLIDYLTSIGITLNADNTIEGKDLIRLYQKIIVADINDAFENEVKRFGDFKSLIQALREEVEARDLGQQYLEALEFVDGTNTETVLPLYHPLHAKRIEEILNSFFKNNVTKQKIPGGSFINVSSYGLDKRLNIKFKNDQTIDYIEAMMPPWSKDFFKEGELISIDKLNALGLTDAVLYRIPTEDKYSMFNIKVVGFLPDASGGVVMLPTEITTIAGLDFDVDKVFAMFYSFKKSVVDNIVDVVQVNGKDTSGFNNLIRIDSGINSKESRDNLKIDIIRAILKNESSVEPFLNTGNFEIIKETAKSIIKYEAGRRKSDIENSEDNTVKGNKLTQELGALNLITTKTKIEIFNRNMTGKALIGVFANHNSNHALTQHSNLELTIPINFNKKSKSSLHETKDTDGNRISKSLATLLAAVVDNAKEPISNFLNLNTYTADTVAMIVRSGHTLKTALTFVSQPAIKELTTRYFNEKGKISEESLFNDISKQLEKNLKDKLNGVKLESGEIPNLNVRDLFANIEKWGQGKEDYDYYLQQYYAFENFKKYKRAADDLAEFVKAGRVDTTGAGPTISENEYRITLVDNVIKKSKNGDSVLLGVEEFFSKDSNTKMVNAFYEKGILEPNEILKKYFPWGEQQFLDIKKLLAKYKGGYLTISELELINYNILTYLASGYEFFDFKYSENIRKELPKRLLSYQSKNKDGNYSKFLNHLHVKDNTKPGQTQKDLFIEFIGTAGITKLDRDIIRNVWQEMLESSESTDEEKQLAEDLIKYTYFTAGFTFTPYSFSHLVPTSFFSKLGVDTEQSFNEYLKKSIEETKQNSDIDSKLLNFTHQFIRNYYHKLGSIVPTVKYDSSENSDPLFDNVKSVSLSGRGKIDVSGDKISLFQSEDGSFKPFIQYEDEKIVYLFEKSKGDNTLYHLTEKLGKVNTALEYDMNTFQPRSTIKQNKKNIPDIIDTDVTAQYSRMIQQMGYEVEDIDYSDLTGDVDTSQEETESISNVNKVEIFKGNWTREEVAKQTDKVFLFGDNTNDRLITNYIPKSTQAVIRGLSNAIGIDTKKDRGTIEDYNLDIVGKVIEIETNNYDFFKSKIDSIERKANNFLVKATNSKGKQYTYLVDSQGQPVNKNSFFEYVELPKKFYTNSYFEDSDFDVFKQQVDEAIQQAKNSGKTIVIPADGIGTGKAMLKEKAPKLFEYLQQELNNLKSQVKTSNQLTESKPTKKLKTLLTDPNQLSLFDADKFIEKGLENGDIKRKDC